MAILVLRKAKKVPNCYTVALGIPRFSGGKAPNLRCADKAPTSRIADKAPRCYMALEIPLIAGQVPYGARRKGYRESPKIITNSIGACCGVDGGGGGGGAKRFPPSPAMGVSPSIT